MSEFASVIELSSLDGITGVKLNGRDPSDRSGSSVANIGDINNDGFDDFMIGASGADFPGLVDAGESYVVFGKADWSTTPAIGMGGLNGSNGFRLNGIDAGDSSGISVAAAGDVNGDGFADFMVSAHRAAPGGNVNAGETYIVFGKADWTGVTALELSTLDGTNGFRLDGIDAGDGSGRSIAGAGDINGDGFADLIVGAYNAAGNGNTAAGETYVVFGKANWTGTSSLNLASLSGSNGFRLDGINVGDTSGVSVSNAGDVNGDGFDDILVGARGADPGGDSKAGQSYVIFGKADWTGTPAFDLSTLNGTNGFRLDGKGPDDFSGSVVAGGGDINGDGFADVLVSAPRANPGGQADAGEVYVVFGKADWSGTPDLGLGSLNGANGFVIRGIDASDLAGSSVASAGDIDGDGFTDIIIGAFGADNGLGSAVGESYVIFGKANWATTSAIELSSLDGNNGFRINGIDPGDYSGRSVSSAGDVNGDGFADLLIGADGADPGGDSKAGESYIIFGRKPSAAVNRKGTVADQTLAGGDLNDTLSALGGDDGVFGHGGNDRLNGGTGNDTITGGTGADRMIGGLGNDVFDFNAIAESTVAAAGRDVITDFNPSAADRIDLSTIDAIPGGGNDAFTFIGSGTFTGLGQVRAFQSGSNTFVDVNVSGTNAPEMRILLVGLVTLNAADFVL